MRGAGAGALAVLLLGACAGAEDRANRPRPPAPITITAAITGSRVLVSPRAFGSGPIVLVVANETGAPQEVTFETAEIAGAQGGLRQTTSPINPRGTATLSVDVRPGRYELRTAARAIRPAAIRVGRRRPSAQDDLMQP